MDESQFNLSPHEVYWIIQTPVTTLVGGMKPCWTNNGKQHIAHSDCLCNCLLEIFAWLKRVYVHEDATTPKTVGESIPQAAGVAFTVASAIAHERSHTSQGTSEAGWPQSPSGACGAQRAVREREVLGRRRQPHLREGTGSGSDFSPDMTLRQAVARRG